MLSKLHVHIFLDMVTLLINISQQDTPAVYSYCYFVFNICSNQSIHRKCQKEEINCHASDDQEEETENRD